MSKLTEKLIEETFMAMLAEMPLNKITVKDIVKQCEINRNTFYYHYQDIPDIIERIIHRETDTLIEKYSSIDTLEKGLGVAIEFALQNKAQVMNVYHSVNRDIYESYLWKLLDYTIEKAFANMSKGFLIKEKDREILMNYYKCTCFGLVTKWLDNDMKNDLVEDFARLCELNKGQMKMLAENCSKSTEKAKK